MTLTRTASLRILLIGALALPLAALAAYGHAPQAHAGTTIVVNTTADDTATDGNCSLEKAIEAANTEAAVDACPAGSGNDTIVLAAGATYALTVIDQPAGPDGLPAISGTMTIAGNGATIERGTATGTPKFRMTDVASGGSLTVTGLTIRGFDSPGASGPGQGGAIYNLGSLTVTGSTITGNMAEPGGGVDGRGGAIFTAGTLTITNSTITGNTAVGTGGSVGGGLILRPGSTTAITSSTFSGNNGNNGADLESESASVTITDTIMTSGCLMEAAFTDGGHNLDSGGSCGFTAGTDIRGANPQLGPLADNGGPTPTQALGPVDPAIDAGGTCPAADGGTDQRGLPRSVPCDIGAFEVQSTTPVVTATAFAGTEGTPVTATVATSVDDDKTANGDLTATIDWGDGTPPSPGTVRPVNGQPTHDTIAGTHTYADEGGYTVTATLVDSDTGPVTVTTTATIADAALTAAGASALTGTEGPTSLLGAGQDTGPVSGTVATFSDASPGTTAADFTATIAWGDGTTSPGTVTGPNGGPFAVTGAHSYEEDGTYGITVTVTDDGGAQASAATSAVIHDPSLLFALLDTTEDLLGG